MTDLESDEMQKDIANCYVIRNSLLHRIIQRNGIKLCLPVIPRPFRWSVINHVHEAIINLGWQKTLDKVYEQYWFDGKSVHSCGKWYKLTPTNVNVYRMPRYLNLLGAYTTIYMLNPLVL